MDYQPKIGARLRELRKAGRWSIGQIAEALGYSYSHIQKIEKDAVGWSPEFLEKAAAFFGVSPGDLLAQPDDVRVPLDQYMEYLSPAVVDWMRRNPNANAYILVSKELSERGIAPDTMRTLAELADKLIRNGIKKTP